MPYVDPQSIEILTAVEAIRGRPGMYLGPLDDPETAVCFVVETLCLSADMMMSKRATRIELSVGPVHGFSLEVKIRTSSRFHLGADASSSVRA